MHVDPCNLQLLYSYWVPNKQFIRSFDSGSHTFRHTLSFVKFFANFFAGDKSIRRFWLQVCYGDLYAPPALQTGVADHNKRGKQSMAYQHILIATDLSPDCHLVLTPACRLQQKLGCRLSLVHVIEPLAMSFGADVPMDLGLLQEQQTLQANERLQDILPDWPALQEEDCHVRYGQPRAEIHQLAEELGCDLILVGSHGRHGLALLLGSTASELLSAAPCDVLAVNLKNNLPNGPEN